MEAKTAEIKHYPSHNLPQRFSNAVVKIGQAKSALEAIDHLETDEDAVDARAVAKDANDVLKAIEEKRKELIRPHLDAQKAINDYAKELTSEVGTELDRVKKLVGSFEAEKERQRQAELRRLEAERKAREAAEAKERARIEAHKSRLAKLERDGIDVVNRALNADKLQQLIDETRAQDISAEFEEFADEYRRIEASMIELAEKRVAFLRERERQQAEAARLDGEAKALKEEEIRQAKERQRLAAEAERQERQAETLRRQQAEADERAREQQKIDEEEAERLAQLEADRVKNLRKTWKFEVVDEALIPREFLTLDGVAVNGAIKANKAALERGTFSIPGLRIYQDTGVVLR